jgi:predicted RNase H-like HicB family nuclease
MDYIEKVLEKLKEWARRLIETLLGPEPQPEPEPIPIPVNDPRRRR